jgi:hypothetical protein
MSCTEPRKIVNRRFTAMKKSARGSFSAFSRPSFRLFVLCSFPFIRLCFIPRLLMLKLSTPFRAAFMRKAVLLGIFLPSTLLLADSLFLKGGERVDGKILSETDTELTIEYKVSASIKDERVIKKTDVEKVEKDSPDIEAWAAIKDFRLSEDSLDGPTYLHYISGLKGFVAQFPQSANAANAKTALDTIEAEKKRVDAGEFKFDGKWLSKEEVQKERTQILGGSYLRQMKRLAAAGRFQDAMGVFESLEKAAGGSAAFPDAVEIARRVAISLKQAADAGVLKVRAKTDEEKRTLEKLTEPQRSQTAKDLKYLRDQVEASVATIERSGAKWMPLSPATERSLTALAAKAGTEIVRLNGLPVENMRLSLKEVEKGKAAVAAKDLAAAEAAYGKAGQYWAANEQVQRGLALVVALRATDSAKMAADKLAAEAAAKTAAEAEAAAKKAADLAALKPAPTPEPAAVAVVEDEPVKEPSFFSKPIGWIIIAVLLAFGGIIAKAIRKGRDPSGNILDQ